VPFLADAVSFGASSALIAAIGGRFGRERAAGAPRASLRAEILEGVRWLLGHRLLRTGVVFGGVANLADSAMDAILVLFAQDELRLGSVGYGLLLTSFAVGGVLGSLVAVRVSRVLGSGTVIVGGILVGAVMALGIGLTSAPGWPAACWRSRAPRSRSTTWSGSRYAKHSCPTPSWAA
jgi:Na+/melibiose symporter-like transporter